MIIRTNVEAGKRKELVRILEGYLDTNSKYMGPPTFSYKVGCTYVLKDGNVEVEDERNTQNIKLFLVSKKLVKGYEDEATKIVLPFENEDDKERILKILHSKQYLLNKALGEERFQIDLNADNESKGVRFETDRVIFTGFPFSTDYDIVNAYTDMAVKILAYAREHKNVSAEETIEENEKFYMRVWLVRMGLGGKEYSGTRKFWMKNLKGHSAFRDEAAQKKWKEKYGKSKA